MQLATVLTVGGRGDHKGTLVYFSIPQIHWHSFSYKFLPLREAPIAGEVNAGNRCFKSLPASCHSWIFQASREQ